MTQNVCCNSGGRRGWGDVGDSAVIPEHCHGLQDDQSQQEKAWYPEGHWFNVQVGNTTCGSVLELQSCKKCAKDVYYIIIELNGCKIYWINLFAKLIKNKFSVHVLKCMDFNNQIA